MFSNITLLIIMSLCAYSMTFGWIEGDLPILKKPKDYALSIHENLVNCFHCVGFYAGILTLAMYYSYILRPFVYVLALNGIVIIIETIMQALFRSGREVNE